MASPLGNTDLDREHLGGEETQSGEGEVVAGPGLRRSGCSSGLSSWQDKEVTREGLGKVWLMQASSHLLSDLRLRLGPGTAGGGPPALSVPSGLRTEPLSLVWVLQQSLEPAHYWPPAPAFQHLSNSQPPDGGLSGPSTQGPLESPCCRLTRVPSAFTTLSPHSHVTQAAFTAILLRGLG